MPDAPYYLCLDQGGHASRALVYDRRGALAAQASVDIATHHPAGDRVEHDPAELVASLKRAIEQVCAALGPHAREIASAGLATQRSSIVCWDRETGAALSPVLSWQDRRAAGWLTTYAPHAKAIERITGLKLSPHYGVSKLRWCLEHLPAVQKARRDNRLLIGPLASFLIFHLLHERPVCADPSNAQRTLLLNMHTLGWDEQLLQLFDVPREILPACASTRRDYGVLRLSASHAVPMTIVTGDQSAALYACGAPRGNVAYLNLGTGAFVQRVTHQPRQIDGVLTSIACQDESVCDYTLEGTVNGAGAALTWAASELAIPELAERLSEWLAAAQTPPLFLNGIGGLGAPYWIPDFPSHFVGDGEPWERAVAVAESIVFLLTLNFEHLQNENGEADSLVLTGGLADNDALCQRLSDLAAFPAWRPSEREATARGLAYLLAQRPSDWSTLQGDWFMPLPNPSLAARYGRWRAEVDRVVG